MTDLMEAGSSWGPASPSAALGIATGRAESADPLPGGLPVPGDDGGARHLPGRPAAAADVHSD